MKSPRKKKWHERAVASFPKGTFRRISAVLDKFEDRTDFLRAAIEAELVRREKKLSREAQP